MNSTKKNLFSTWPGLIAGILFSGICWYFAFSLSGAYGWLLWFAAIPVLLMAYQASAGKAFLVSFIAYLIARLSWLPYLLSVAPLFLALVFTLVLPILFSLVVLASRFVMIRRMHWTSSFAFPVFFCAFEFLSFIFSHDGTFGSIAYSVANCLPLVQVASVTGILGISFILCFVPSAIAAWFFLRSHHKPGKALMIVGPSLFCAVIVFGFWRIAAYRADGFIRTGMTVIDEKLHWQQDSAGIAGDVLVANQYVRQIKPLAAAGASIILLPENIVNATTDSILKIFTTTSRDYHISILMGYRIKQKGKLQNRAIVISPAGEVTLDYQKKNLFEGEIMDGFVPGIGKPGVFNFRDIPVGLAICKDMDFQSYIGRYNALNPKIFFTPAWDFDQDDWLHSRMAILRGVENGYTVVRNARRGRLTISDDRGKVWFESSSSNNKPVSLTGLTPYSHTRTFYSHTGDWFGIINLVAALAFLFLSMYRRM